MASILEMIPLPPNKRDAVLASALAELIGGEDVVQLLHERHVQRYTYRAIAEHSGVSHVTVQIRLRRAHTRLRRVLHRHGIALPWDGPQILQDRPEPAAVRESGE